MQKSFFVFLSLLVLSSGILPAQNAPQSKVQAQIAQMRDYITTNMKADNGNPSGVAFRSAMNSASELSQIDNYLSNNDWRTAIQQAKGAANRTEDPTLKKLWEGLVKQLETDLETIQKDMIAEMTKTLTEGSKLLLEAKKPEDIDAYLEKLSNFQEQRNQFNWSRPLQKYFSRIDQSVGFAQQWQDFISARNDQDIQTAQNILNNLRNYPNAGRLVSRSELSKISKELAKAGDPDTQELENKLTASLKKAGETIQKAQKDTDLDTAFDELSDLQAQRPPNIYQMPKLNRLFQQLDQAINALSQYQSYLAQMEAGNPEPAKNELRNFLYSNARARLVPQSWIASKMNIAKSDTAEVDKLMTALTAANLSETLDKIQSIAENDFTQRRNEYYGLLNDLRHLQGIEMINQTRGPVEAYNRMGQPGGQHQWRPQITSLSLAMQTQYAAKILGVKIEAPKDGSPETTLNNLLAQFAKDKNWPGMAKVLELIRNGQFYGTTSADIVNGELAAVRNFLVASQMEKTGQKEEAIKYYIDTLKYTSDRLPLSEAAERLAKLKGQ